ncbi:MAG: hypothetical protein WKF75_02210 [Singulisphaera sp.]
MRFSFRPSAPSLPPASHAAHRRRRPLLEALEDRCLLSNYYVSPSGSDLNDGSSSGGALKTIRRPSTSPSPATSSTWAPAITPRTSSP